MFWNISSNFLFFWPSVLSQLLKEYKSLQNIHYEPTESCAIVSYCVVIYNIELDYNLSCNIFNFIVGDSEDAEG